METLGFTLFKAMKERKKAGSKQEKQRLGSKIENYRSGMQELKEKKDRLLDDYAEKKSQRNSCKLG